MSDQMTVVASEWRAAYCLSRGYGQGLGIMLDHEAWANYWVNCGRDPEAIFVVFLDYLGRD